ncbi:SDR family NAD(P)-dependent oxidoreductase [Parasphingorhabdus pacifica]
MRTRSTSCSTSSCPAEVSVRTVLVTGGGTGFGLAIATRFAKDGDRVYITGRRKAVLDEACRSLGGQARAH